MIRQVAAMFFRKSFGGKAVLCALLAALAGCSSGHLPTYPVSGQVVFTDGAPVHVGTIELKSREHGLQARGEIDTSGHFVLSTYAPSDGAVAGTHDCVIVQMVLVEGIANFRPSTKGVVPPRYGSYATSALVAEVNAQDHNELRLQIEPLVPGTSPRAQHSHGPAVQHHEHGPGSTK